MIDTLGHGDALDFLTHVHTTKGAKVDLCYVDPPFNAGGTFGARTEQGERRTRVASDDKTAAYTDSWGGLDGFIEFLEPRLDAIRQCLSNHGVLWLHLDHRAIHDAKLACDRVFGRTSFRGEVIWVPGNGARSRKGPSMTHQTIVIYQKSTKEPMVWNDDHALLREPYADTSLAMHFTEHDAQGRRFRERTMNGKAYRYYADEGRRIGSVWLDAPSMVANTPLRKEGTGYPTQKPEKLLERIIRLSSVPGNVVCDPMCGSGTTLVVAAKLGRHFLGNDIGDKAFTIAQTRLAKENRSFEVWGSSAEPAILATTQPYTLPLNLQLSEDLSTHRQAK